jgi:hypothetical protein
VLNDPFINDLDAGSQGESFEGSCASDEQSNEDSEGGSVMDDGEDDEANLKPTVAEKCFAGEVCFLLFNTPSAESNCAYPASDLVR